jgi:hypothetical protein
VGGEDSRVIGECPYECLMGRGEVVGVERVEEGTEQASLRCA